MSKVQPINIRCRACGMAPGYECRNVAYGTCAKPHPVRVSDAEVLGLHDYSTPAPVSDKGDLFSYYLDEDDGVYRIPHDRMPGLLATYDSRRRPQPPAGAALSEVAQNIVHEWEWGRRPSATDILAAFAERVRAEEREACAKVADRQCDHCIEYTLNRLAYSVAADIAANIRSRAGSGSKP